jgi:hypothetical protein
MALAYVSPLMLAFNINIAIIAVNHQVDIDTHTTSGHLWLTACAANVF